MARVRSLSLLFLLFASTLFGQHKLELPASPVDPTWVTRFRVSGVEKWEDVDDLMLLTAVGSVPIFVDY